MNFHFDLFVIGAGSAGIRAAIAASAFGANVGIAEENNFGGTCVNLGCIPKKMFFYSADCIEYFKYAALSYGFDIKCCNLKWQLFREKQEREINKLRNLYFNLLVNKNIKVIKGHASLIDNNTIKINKNYYKSKYILIATGSWPKVPNINGKEYIMTSNEILCINELPKKMIIVGGGYIAVEFASIFNALGVDTTLIYRSHLFLKGCDISLRKQLYNEFIKKGLKIKFNTNISNIYKKHSDNKFLNIVLQNGIILETDFLCYAIGRRPMLDNLGLENINIEFTNTGFIKTNQYFQTNEQSIFAVGDVIGGLQLTPIAIAEAISVVQYLFNNKNFRLLDYRLIPKTVFSIPNISSVGLTEEQALNYGYKIKIFEKQFIPLKFRLLEKSEHILLKLIVDAENDKVLGCHMIGNEAGEIIQGLTIALKLGATKKLFDETIGIHPTIAEEFFNIDNRMIKKT